MQDEQLEAWVLSIVDQVAQRRRVEDSRVELKAKWPDPKQAARRIAGHANAAGGESVLWIVGLDETKGVISFSPIEMATWSSQLAEQFDGLAPPFRELLIPTALGTVVALLFETSRRPFVVKNSVHGTSGGGPVSLEVPWREGTAVRSARREDLLRILVPIQVLPAIEVLSASASARLSTAVTGYPLGQIPRRRKENLEWRFGLLLYVTPRTSDVVVLPTHKAQLSFTHGLGLPETVFELHFHPPITMGSNMAIRDSHTISSTSSEAIIAGPGRLWVECRHSASPGEVEGSAELAITLTLVPAGQDRSIDVCLSLKPKEVQQEFQWAWEWNGQQSVR